MQINSLERKHPNKTSRQLGRGGKRGKTSGRGHKGQKARAGHRIRPEIRDEIKSMPKLRGYRFSSFTAKPIPVNLALLEKHYKEGEAVTVVSLMEKGLVKKQGGKAPAVKILGNGDITKKLNVEGIEVSTTAREKIEKAGGKIS
ncbi:MAG: uL15 family ribosomal protein [Candidatus Campbellbacteria bacterium]|nr:uL15 family ribosomal protein [Candidatus Campbellbacteria bacterium]